MFRIVFALILLSISIVQAKEKHAHISQNDILGKMKEAVLAVESMNGYITRETELITYSGEYFGKICTKNKHTDCISFTNGVINSYLGIEGKHEDAQYPLYSASNIIFDGFELTRALVIDGNVILIAYINNQTKEEFVFRGASEIDAIISSDKEFKKRTIKSSSSNDVILPHQLSAIKSLKQQDETSIETNSSFMLDMSNLKYPKNPNSIKHTPSKTTAIVFYTSTALASSGSYDRLKSKTKDISVAYRNFMKNNDIFSDLPKNYFYWYAAEERDENNKVIKKAIMPIPDSICRQVSGGCEGGNYNQIIAAISSSQIVRGLKQKWKADVTMLYVNNNDRGGAVGKATLLTSPRDLSQANNAVIVASVNYPTDVYIHEIMHNLGAGHAPLNKDPGKSPGHAYMKHFQHIKVGGRHGIRTFMGYDDVCNKHFKSILPCTSGCFSVNLLSTPLKKTSVTDQDNIQMGSNFNDNRSVVSSMIWTVNNFSTYYKSNNPIISYITEAPEPNILQYFSAENSSVNNGEILNWSVTLPNGLESHRRSFGDKNKQFYFKPAVVGTYKVNLKIGSKTTSYSLVVKIEQLKAPQYSLIADSSRLYWTVRWDNVENADHYISKLNGVLLNRTDEPLWGKPRSFRLAASNAGKTFSMSTCNASGKCGNARSITLKKMCSNGQPFCI
ncbi:hypothetical protein [Pseudoalteromonas spongiae]|uniref:hypothetical protein n=1 Tax=Pseudoalteromonas spongiae TaxID=298657 RepID=UPI00110BE167|nr:hypothetical protein [Pseudoalteromonas spongiae]TMO84824.1 hypothetical protein CWC15_09580 [Pseudoalteromonas spongiae]